MLEEVLKNPIGYYGHEYADGVLLLWDDVRIEGDNILGKPVINMEHPRAERTVKEIEEGFLNAASVGNIVVLEHEFETVEGMEEPMLVVTKWYYKECSLVDSPGNRNAFRLYDQAEQEISLPNLKDSFKTNNNNMKTISLKLTPALVAVLNLSDAATPEDVEAGINALDARAKQGDAAVAENATLKTEVQSLKDKEVATEVAALLQKGLSDKKLTVQMKQQLELTYAGKPKELKNLMDTMPVHQSIVEKIDQAKATVVSNLQDKSWDELDKEDGALQNLKDNDFEAFKVKFKAKFNRDYAG